MRNAASIYSIICFSISIRWRPSLSVCDRAQTTHSQKHLSSANCKMDWQARARPLGRPKIKTDGGRRFGRAFDLATQSQISWQIKIELVRPNWRLLRHCVSSQAEAASAVSSAVYFSEAGPHARRAATFQRGDDGGPERVLALRMVSTVFLNARPCMLRNPPSGVDAKACGNATVTSRAA